MDCLSAERVSEAEYGGLPDALGDYSASPHTQGELIGAMLDLRDPPRDHRAPIDGRRHASHARAS